ncbi:shikimate kinase [Liquorilactobacillus mali]|uniref:Shikimate kinase n=1 Tax=Liquorilactobacillus mali KCTC 3596 = DSM 20444 TaxID=1046596 RepID=A0A0R2E4Q1_9LACO|nr:shikimate kinase [Liquorilactobacillus mali]KRN08629.1 shikimate kinase [Liquorilactobacillus mali KCTC 3596 = DSM 20444]MDC7952591.1 shikimate kinase [Liquorilactobacillus mali]MDN7145603.1 shikimate kinase [Liquorilactobacillus mali]QFQ73733.1 shikimate kinase [Liquorilactobacillus mali]
MDAILIGFMGSGKTTIGRMLAKTLLVPHTDLDQEIVENAGQTIPEFFSNYGEKKFRELEHQILLNQLKKNGVLSTGGGTPISMQNLEILQATKAPVILLEASTNTILERVGKSKERPLVNQMSVEQLAELQFKRMPFYQKCANLRINTDNHSPLEITEQIYKYLSVN